ncbi:conserved exported hypothetical protein [Rubrivivax sp. A210]|uniref:hypothetical protein n=1 Tax=Rubrivivax sp. A210 TaxID=2772301 RepID=UPI00191A2B5D|nr:hypothetical protein [Rubrivivax sp. A210]CAD5372134.1 conserved exported hypothetical protein [Rubrivivax sp. A210]
MKACCTGWLALVAAAAVQAQVGPSASVVEPRAFGYLVGDVLQRRVTVDVPPGWVLDPESLPPVRRPGQALELRRLRWQGGPELLLEYQVFLAPRDVYTLEAPPLKLRFHGPGGERGLRIDAWPVTVAPLLPAEISPRTGLGDMRPDAPPPLFDLGPAQQRLSAYAALLALAAIYLLHVYVGLPWLARRSRPFGRAWRPLMLAVMTPDVGGQRRAFEEIHRALNATAGEALFAAGLEPFLHRHPHFAPLRPDLTDFFRRSEAGFFAGQWGDDSRAWLLELGRRCRNLERGSA